VECAAGRLSKARSHEGHELFGDNKAVTMWRERLDQQKQVFRYMAPTKSKATGVAYACSGRVLSHTWRGAQLENRIWLMVVDHDG
jgi:hypothetical protein